MYDKYLLKMSNFYDNPSEEKLNQFYKKSLLLEFFRFFTISNFSSVLPK